MSGSTQPYEVADLGGRGYYHATEVRSSRWVEALQRDDKDFLPLAPKAYQLIFVRCSLASMLPLQTIRIDIRADGAVEVLHSFPFTLVHHLPCLMNNRVPALALFEGNQHIGTGNGDHKFPGIYLDRHGLAIAGTVVRYDNDFPVRTSDGTDRGLEESRGVNPPEVRVFDSEKFRCTRNVSEVHGRHFTATTRL